MQETSITVFSVQDNNYFSLTDIARKFKPFPAFVIKESQRLKVIEAEEQVLTIAMEMELNFH